MVKVPLGARFLGIVLLAATLLPVIAEPADSDLSFSGLAVNALVKAYEHLGIGQDSDAPLLLESYVVTIRQYGPAFTIRFGKHSTGEQRGAFIDARTGSVVTPQADWPWEGLSLLPGVVAGEIIAAYHYALTDSKLAGGAAATLKSGAYNLYLDPGATDAWLLFQKLNSPAPSATMFATATATPSAGWTCLAGACHNEMAYYRVTLNGSRVNIQLRGIL